MDAQARDESWQDTQAAQAGAEEPRPARGPARQERMRRVGAYHPAVLIAAAVLLIAVLWLAVHSVNQRRARIAAAEIVRVNAEAERKAQLQAELQQREEAVRQQARQAELDRQEALKRQAIREREQQDEAARKAVAAEELRKEQAWLKFYRKPASCNDSGTIECANGYIKARRVFEEKYGRGEL
jgi:hypothetical protein